jgi:hypothetical protein
VPTSIIVQLHLHATYTPIFCGSCPTHFSASALYLLYAKLEEEHGMARHAMAVYERATKAVLPEEMFEVRRIVASSSHSIFFSNVSIFIWAQ